jgi:hypothetical protein
VFYFINSRHIMWLAGGLEVALAVFLWCRRNSEIVFPVIGTLAAVLIIYRLGAYWTGHTRAAATVAVLEMLLNGWLVTRRTSTSFRSGFWLIGFQDWFFGPQANGGGQRI